MCTSENYASARFRGLTQIDAGNVCALKRAWSFSTGVLRGQEAPLIVNGTMHIVTPFLNVPYDVDLTKPGGPLNGSMNPTRSRRHLERVIGRKVLAPGGRSIGRLGEVRV